MTVLTEFYKKITQNHSNKRVLADQFNELLKKNSTKKLEKSKRTLGIE